MRRLLSCISSPFGGVAPLTTNAAPRNSEKDCATVSFDASVAATRKTKQVHFADDCGKVLESVREISDQRSCTGERFHENLHEVRVDRKHGVLTAFLNVAGLEQGRTLLVRYTENEWRTHKTVPGRQVDRAPCDGVQSTEESRGVSGGETAEDKQSDGGSSRISSNDDVLRYVFQFPVGKRSGPIELAVVSSLDGVVDNWHDKSYKLKTPRCTKVDTAASGHSRCVKCW